MDIYKLCKKLRNTSANKNPKSNLETGTYSWSSLGRKLFVQVLVVHNEFVDNSNLCGKLIIGEKEIYHPMQSVCTVNKLVGVWSVWQVSNVAGVDRW